MTATRLLTTWSGMLDECYDTPGLSRHPVFVALHESIVACDLPRKPFGDLLRAFQNDQVKTRFASLDELEGYSRYSANPVGSLVLYTCGYRDAALHALSDRTCTALQLANFWQDVGEDLRDRDRIYVPQDRMAKHNVTEADLLSGHEGDGYRAMMRELVEDTRAMLLEGAPLIDLVDRELAATLRLFTQGGLAILTAIEAIDYNTLSRRPRGEQEREAAAVAGRRSGQVRPATRIERSALVMVADPELVEAYAVCRAIAKREAKNFYYGFLALPAHKRDAMCAVYAFMRRADDIADDESVTLEQRRIDMQRWLASWRGEAAEEPHDALVFLAVRDVQQRFGVACDLLEQLVQGTTMDLDPEPPAGVRRIQVGARVVDQYETMEALERYCYLVASVVGLTTIRIFGCTAPKADAYAEQLGLAFQLTNILRDVKEDAERGRIYLPETLLRKHGVTAEDVLTASADRQGFAEDASAAG